MVPDPLEPVLRVGVIRLAPMHEAMPVTAGGGMDFLTQGVRLVQKIVVQPQRGQAALGHVLISDVDMTEGLFQGQGFELSLNLSIGSSRPEMHEPALLKKGGDDRTINCWTKRGHDSGLVQQKKFYWNKAAFLASSLVGQAQNRNQKSKRGGLPLQTRRALGGIH